MEVRATMLGFYKQLRRRVGDVFEIEDDMFSEVWMESVDGSEPKIKEEPKAPKKSKSRKKAVAPAESKVEEPTIKLEETGSEDDVI